jgi:hypothetical protein
MICLPDVNLWIALTSNQHIHHVRAALSERSLVLF